MTRALLLVVMLVAVADRTAVARAQDACRAPALVRSTEPNLFTEAQEVELGNVIVDLVEWSMVVIDDDADERELDPRFAWRLGARSGVSADVIFCRASEFAEARDVVNTLSYDAAHRGQLLLER